MSRRLSRWCRPDRRLVEHVEGADETGPDLTGEPDALCLATRERAGRSRQRQVVEPDVEQEAQPRVDLLGHPLGDQSVTLGELERGEELGRLADRHLTDLGDVLVADRDRQGVGLQACATAGATRDLAHVTLVLLARPVTLGTLVTTLDPGDDALVLGGVRAVAAVPVLVLDGQLALHPVQQDLLLLRREIAPRRIEIDVVDVRHRLEHAGEVLGVRAPPRRDRAVVDRRVGIGDDEFGIDLERGAETVTGLTGAVRRVEREVAGRRLLVARAAHRAGQVLAERQRLGLGPRRVHPTV